MSEEIENIKKKIQICKCVCSICINTAYTLHIKKKEEKVCYAQFLDVRKIYCERVEEGVSFPLISSIDIRSIKAIYTTSKKGKE